MRLDQWLWAVRIYKTRTVAAEAIKAGHVQIDSQAVKPARPARPGEIVAARLGPITRTVKVLATPPSRVGAPLVAQFMEDLTLPEEYAKRREPHFLPTAERLRGTGRPTKRQRRELDASDFQP